MATLGTLEYLISIDSSKVSSGLSDAEGKVEGFGNRLSTWAVAKGQVIGNMVTKAGSSAMDFVKDSVQESMGFDKAMSQVAATLGKSTDEMGQLSAFAREMGSKTAFSASQAAEALNYMALAGYDDQTSMKMLPTVLNLAAAGGMELATASDMVTDAQSALGLSIEETEQMVDMMAKTSSKTNTSVEQLGNAFLTIGGTAKMLRGGTIELSAALGVLADNGIKGSEGGTALRNVILSLGAPTDKAAEALKTLGISVYDSQGKMRELPAILADINERTKNMSDKTKKSFFNDIFNKNDLKAVEALLATSSERWSELYEEIGNADGAAEQMAETQLDNLAGDLTIFQSALSEAKLSLVEGLTPALRTFVQRGTNLLSRVTTAFGKRGFQGVLDEVKRSFWSLTDQMVDSSNPVVSAIGKIARAFKTGFTWENLKGAIQSGWESIQKGVDSLAKIVFGERVDGSVDWPTWEDIGEAITSAWDTIKENVKGLAKIVFGENADGSIKWPTWDDISSELTGAWDTIKENVKGLAKIVFGENVDGTIKWPKWADIEKFVKQEWGKIKTGVSKLSKIAFGDNVDITTLEGLTTLFSNIEEGWKTLRSTIIENAINIGTYFFGDQNAETVSTAIKVIADALKAVGAAIITYDIVTTLPKVVQTIKDLFTFNVGGSKVALILAGIAAAFTLIYEHWDELQPILASIGDWFMDNIVTPVNKAIEAIRRFFGMSIPGELSGEQMATIKGAWAATAFDYMDAEGDAKKEAEVAKKWNDFVKDQLSDAEMTAEQIEAAMESLNFDTLMEQFQTQNLNDFNSALDTTFENINSANTKVGELKESATQTAGRYDLDFYINTYGDMPTVNVSSGSSTGRIRTPKGWVEPVGKKAKGDWNVPYDDYPALLHRGEMVLNKSQARAFRDGLTGGGINMESLSASIQQAIKTGMENATVRSYLNGRDITSDVNRRQIKQLKARRYAT